MLFKNNCLPACHSPCQLSPLAQHLPHSFLLSFIPGLELSPHEIGVGSPTHPYFSDALLLLVERGSLLGANRDLTVVDPILAVQGVGQELGAGNRLSEHRSVEHHWGHHGQLHRLCTAQGQWVSCA